MSLSNTYAWVLGALAVLIVARLVNLLSSQHGRLPLPPGPKPLPLIGNIHQLPKSYLWLYFYYMSKIYGPIMHFSMAGQSVVMLSSQQIAHDLLDRRGARYSDRPRMVMAGELVTKGMHMLLRPYDERYKLHRRMAAPLLNPQSAKAYRSLQDIESRQLLVDVLGEWDKHGEKGIDFHHHHKRATASTMYCLIYGYRLKTGREKELMDANKVQAEFIKSGQVGTYLVDSFPWLNNLPSFLTPWKANAEELYELEKSLHLGNLTKGLNNEGWNFSKHMEASSEARDMSVEELAYHLGILADAGLDTSSVALDWFIVAWVTTGSHWVTKAQSLIDKVVGRDRLPNFDDRPKLAYIDAIVYEVLRWRPVAAGGVSHYTKTEDEYQGYRIPANSVILPNFFAITRDETLFGKDTDSFIPERWLTDPAEADGKTSQMDTNGTNVTVIRGDLPQTGFGFGRRLCTGRHIARNQLFIQMARMLWCFDVESGVATKTGAKHLVNDMDSIEGFVNPPKPFRAVFRPRGQWVRDVIAKCSDTHGIDHVNIRDQVKEARSSST
ncbi:cytochrome P450 [Stachybotrys elegans]|uniref:Cytochrome P450 n=1 Tax=Stachybotrys elegans TaxID=80388 RepID=A0A8K0SGA2_9HYPO|nr:cytochrome P450 [Stachybotrys elegans]